MANRYSSSNYEYHVTPAQLVIYVFPKGDKYGDRQKLAVLLTDLGMGECRLSLARGGLDDEINQQMMLICKDMGYKKIQFEVPHGTNASRHATFQFTDGVLDRYTVEI